MKKNWLLMVLLPLLLILPIQNTSVRAAEPKVAVLFSETSERYANEVRPGGKLNGAFVDPKDDWSSIYDKELKMFHLYKQQGFNVEKIYEKDLTNLKKLHEYEAIVFPYTVMMDHSQREGVKAYVRDGGGAIFAYSTARNESATYPKQGQLDLTPLIYDTKTWIWEWDNLSEVYQSAFVNDVVIKDYKVKTTDVQHPILTAAYNELGKNSIELTNTRSGGDWIEVIAPWNDAVKPLLVYTDYSYSSSPIHTTKNSTGAVYAFEHGKGRMVFTGFKIYDHFNVKADDNWEDRTAGSAYDQTTGDWEAQVLLKHSLKWVMEGPKNAHKRLYDVTMDFTGLQGYLRANDYSVYGSVTVRNKGNVPARGKIRVEAVQANGNVLASYERYLPGLSPDTKQTGFHTEKFHLVLPKTLAQGTYQLRTVFIDGRDDRLGNAVKAEVVNLVHKKGPAVFQPIPMFKDIPTSHEMMADMRNLAHLRIIRGYPDGTFKPGQSVTRTQATEMTLRALNIPISTSATMAATDLKKGAYGYDVLATGVAHGIIALQDGKINAVSPMQRGDMARTLVNGFKLQGMSTHQFTDISSTHPYYAQIQTLLAVGVTTGYTNDNTYRPDTAVSRAQFSAFLNRSLKASSR